MLKMGAGGGQPLRWVERLLLTSWLQWRWRNREVFSDLRLSMQEKMRQVVNFFEVDRAVFEKSDAPLRDMSALRSN